MARLTVLVNAGPWLPVPPPGYGGIENVVATLVPALRARGAPVVLCAAAGAMREGGIDVVHDHLEVVGLSTLAAMGDAIPPVLHTLHWDLHKHPDFYGRFD